MYQKLVKNIIASTLFVSLSILTITIQVQAYDNNIITVMAKVQVSGAVKKPGIYTVPQGTRLVDLLSKAGGLRKDAVLTDVNMTTPVTDGSNIFIASKNDKINPVTKIEIPRDSNLNSKKISKKSSKKSKSKKKDLIKSNQLISLNKATEEELNSLPGVGEKLAQSIISYRNKHRFIDISDLRKIEGIGEKKFKKIKSKVTL